MTLLSRSPAEGSATLTPDFYIFSKKGARFYPTLIILFKLEELHFPCVIIALSLAVVENDA